MRIQCVILSVNKLKYCSVTLQIGETQSLTDEKDYESVKGKLDCFYFNLGFNLVDIMAILHINAPIRSQLLQNLTCNKRTTSAMAATERVDRKIEEMLHG